MPAKVSVIIPVYGAEKTIGKCAESLFSQTLDEIEYIFVNDCTPDRSMEVLQTVSERYPARKGQIRIVDMPVNSKQAAARNAGLLYATGDYVIHCDPDDWIDIKLYQEMYEMAVREDLDIVSCDYIVENIDGSSQLCNLAQYTTPIEAFKCPRFYSMSLCLHMVRRDIIRDNKLTFTHGINFSEDACFLTRVFVFGHTMGHIGNNFYHYRKSEQSITASQTKPHIVSQRIAGINDMCDFLRRNGYNPDSFDLISRQKRDIKNLFLKKDTLDKWVKLFPEVCDWECRQPGASLIYKVAYRLSHKIGVWPMRLLLSLHH